MENFTSLDAIFQTLELPPEYSGEVIRGAICLQPNNPLLNLLNGLLNGTQSINLTFENPACDNTVLQDLFTMAVPAVREVLAARTRDEFCRLVLRNARISLNFHTIPEDLVSLFYCDSHVKS